MLDPRDAWQAWVLVLASWLTRAFGLFLLLHVLLKGIDQFPGIGLVTRLAGNRKLFINKANFFTVGFLGA